MDLDESKLKKHAKKGRKGRSIEEDQDIDESKLKKHKKARKGRSLVDEE